jgi:NADH:ubiquinone oxidoreductase subunit H
MQNETNYGVAVAVAIIVVILFFGGWYIFIGQALNGPVGVAPVTPEISTSTNPIVYGTSTENIEATTSVDINN